MNTPALHQQRREEKRTEATVHHTTDTGCKFIRIKNIIKSSWKNILKTFILAATLAQHKVGQKIKYTFSLDSCTLANRGKREIGVKPRILGVKEHLHL